MRVTAVSRYTAVPFPASRGLSGREINESRGERPLPASDGLFDEAADQISGRNFPVFKTGFRYTRLHALFYSLLKTSEPTVSQAKHSFDHTIIKNRLFLPLMITISKK